MDYITDWARQLAVYLIFQSVLSNLVRKQNYQKYIRLVMGIILIILLATPVLKLLKQSENYQFHLSRYLLAGEAKDNGFINEIGEKKEAVLFSEVESVIRERIHQIAEAYGLVIDEVNLQFCTEEDGYGNLEQITLVLTSDTENYSVYGTDSPDAIRIRERLSEEFGTKKSEITVTIY